MTPEHKLMSQVHLECSKRGYVVIRMNVFIVSIKKDFIYNKLVLLLPNTAELYPLIKSIKT